jgi:hypothetical protein
MGRQTGRAGLFREPAQDKLYLRLLCEKKERMAKHSSICGLADSANGGKFIFVSRCPD